jgi:membrane protease YdiL (CAAX protease family)
MIPNQVGYQDATTEQVLPKTERYLDLAAQGRSQWWLYALGVFIIPFPAIFLVFAILVILIDGLGVLSLADAERFIQEPDKPVLYFVLLNVSVITMLPGLAVAVKLLHRRPLLSLVTPDPPIDWRRIARGAVVWIVLMAAFTAFEHVLFPDRYRLSFNAERFFPFLLPVLVLTPMQAATEELLRGYLMQALSLLTRRPTLIATLSSLAFSALHFENPEVERYGVAIMAANYFVCGILFSTIALRDGRLELAIGVHAGNNLFCALVSNNEGSVLKTESIFISSFDPAYGLVAALISTLACHWWIFGRSGVLNAPRC